MNVSFQQSQPTLSEEIEQIIKLKVELTKYKSKLQGYKQMEIQYKAVSIKYQFVQQENQQLKRNCQIYSNKLKQIMELLAIDYLTILGYQTSHYLKSQRNVNSQGLRGKINTIQNIKLKKQQYSKHSTSRNVQQQDSVVDRKVNINNEEIIFKLISNKIKQIIKNNQQMQQTLQKLQKSDQTIRHNSLQHHLIIQKLQTQVKNKYIQIQSKSTEITSLNQRILLINSQLQQQQKSLQLKDQQLQKVINMHKSLQHMIKQLKQQTSEQQHKKQLIRQKCHRFVQQNFQLDEQAYLKNYLQGQTLIMQLVNNNYDRFTKQKLMFSDNDNENQENKYKMRKKSKMSTDQYPNNRQFVSKQQNVSSSSDQQQNGKQWYSEAGRRQNKNILNIENAIDKKYTKIKSPILNQQQKYKLIFQ